VTCRVCWQCMVTSECRSEIDTVAASPKRRNFAQFNIYGKGYDRSSSKLALPTSINFLKFNVINCDPLVNINAIFKRRPEMRIILFLHNVIMILFRIPSQKRIKREPKNKINPYPNRTNSRVLIRIFNPHPMILLPNDILLKIFVVCFNEIGRSVLFNVYMTDLCNRTLQGLLYYCPI
jgi:hypothetical protein